MTRKVHISWKGFHRWAGIVMAVFLLVFCVSGIILNHRSAVRSCSVSRSLLPSDYHFSNFNNGMVKGTLALSDGRLLAFGNSGAWLTDSSLSAWQNFNRGLPDDLDGRNIRNIVADTRGRLWCAAQYGLYRHDGNCWREVALPGNEERMADVAVNPVTGEVAAMTRSAVYTGVRPGLEPFVRHELAAPPGHSGDVTLFKTVWQLHSGQLFGLPGVVVVDLVALVLIFLSITGIILFIMPYAIRRSAKERIAAKARRFKWNFRWHDRVGYLTAVLTLIIAVTGMCLRPPLMVPLVLTKTPAVPGTSLSSDNPFHDRLRALRWDAEAGEWLLSTSEGFMRTDEDFGGEPRMIDQHQAPPLSPMGVTVLEPCGDGRWLVGSFRGMFIWHPAGEGRPQSEITEYFTGKPYHHPLKMEKPLSDHLVAGYSGDIKGGPVVFDYAAGASRPLEMSEELSRQPMPLWNVALELHVGRCYTPFLGPVSVLFVFLSGLLITLVLVSGLILHSRHKRVGVRKNKAAVNTLPSGKGG